jgi:uracil phosphoribosyltransferase
MTDAMLSLFPNAPVYHIGLFREKVSLQPVECEWLASEVWKKELTQDSRVDYSKLPSVPTVDQVFVVDPLIATGGTAVAAVNMILDWGIPRACPLLSSDPAAYSPIKTVKNIKFLGILASQAGLDHVKSEFPELEASQHSVAMCIYLPAS